MLVTLKVKGLYRVIPWVIHKELGSAINKAYLMVKFRVSHSEFHKEEKSRVMKDQDKSYHVDLVRLREMVTLRMGVKSFRN